mgnify:CR=1 FL=1
MKQCLIFLVWNTKFSFQQTLSLYTPYFIMSLHIYDPDHDDNFLSTLLQFMSNLMFCCFVTAKWTIFRQSLTPDSG